MEIPPRCGKRNPETFQYPSFLQLFRHSGTQPPLEVGYCAPEGSPSLCVLVDNRAISRARKVAVSGSRST